LAEDVKGEALAGLVMNNQRGNLESLAVRAPDVAGRQEDRLQELAAALSATVLPDSETGRSLASIELSDLGRADQVISNRNETTILGFKGNEDAIAKRIALIERQIDEAQTDQYVRYMNERIGALRGQTAYLRVGGLTEAETKERLPRVRNAVASCKAALKSGWVPGAGVAYLSAAAALDNLGLDGDEATGLRILQSALVVPLLTVIHNTGEEPSIILNRLGEAEDDSTFDAVSGRIVKAHDAGILDATSTIEAVIRRAVSIATTLITVDVAITELPNASPFDKRLDMGAKYE
jgi:chaperonin GroEL